MISSRSFPAFAAKRLSAVEAYPSVSNQHEFNGISALRRILGDHRVELPIQFTYLTDGGPTFTADDSCTWYDARENHPTRTEFRLYFPSNPVMNAAEEGDLILFCANASRALTVIVAPSGSNAETQLLREFRLRI